MNPNSTRRIVVAAALMTMISNLALAQSAEMALFPAARELRATAPPPLRLAARVSAPMAVLEPAATVARPDLEKVRLYNTSGRLPLQNGFARDLFLPRRVVLDPALALRSAGELEGGLVQRAEDDRLVWGTEIRVEGSHRVRLHLDASRLPAGSEMWVYNDSQSLGPFGLELRAPEGDLWTPSIAGPVLRFELRLPAGASATELTVDRVLELFQLDSGGSPITGATRGAIPPCLVDATCVGSGTFNVIDLAEHAIAYLEFAVGASSFICSGGLLNTNPQTDVPYLLTANHCFSSQSSATSLEAFFDFFTSTCNGAEPSLTGLPRAVGATLLATNPTSDFTFVRLNSLPSGRALLGWSGTATTDGEVLHRLSHPGGLPQNYSRNHVDTVAPTCSGASRGPFVYETYRPGQGDQGGTFGGSSGSPVMRSGGVVVGQLTGGCGPNPNDGCDYDNAEVDGAFATTINSILSFLTPGANTCIPDGDTLCFVSDRFKAELTFRLTAGGAVTAGGAQELSDLSGTFFFNNPNNREMLVKMLNGCAINNRYWVFLAATTNVNFTLTVTDTSRTPAVTKVYTNPLNTAALPVQDTSAFATCP